MTCRALSSLRREGCGRWIHLQRYVVGSGTMGSLDSYTDFSSELGKRMIKTSLIPKLYCRPFGLTR